jgi:hypothetical protein
VTAHDQISTAEGLCSFADEWLGIRVPLLTAAKWARQARKHRERWTTTVGPYIWIKNRLSESGWFDFAGHDSPDWSHPTAVLHVGYVSLFESPEMISRLTNEPMDDGSPSRSRLAKEMQVRDVKPIDGTAARVCQSNH